MAEKDVLGRAGEDRAALYFEALGYEVIARNWRCAAGEIDLIATRAEELVFVEVKTRRSDGFGHPFEAIDRRKRVRLWRLGVAWIAEHRDQVQGRRVRLDAIGLTGTDPASAVLEHIQDLEIA